MSKEGHGMKVRAYVLVGVALLLVIVVWVARRTSSPPDAKKIAKDLSIAAKSGAAASSNCEVFFSEWDALIQERSVLDEKRVGRLADQVGRYPGIPGATFSAWKLLTNLPADQDVDVSFALGLSDCQYDRFGRTAGRLAMSLRTYRKKVKGCDRPVRASLGVLREVLDRPVSRQALRTSVELAFELRRTGWVQWNKEDGAEWVQIDEYLRKFNKRADGREGELTQKLGSFPSFKDAPAELRKGLAVQLRYSYTQTEAARKRVRALVSNLKLTPG